MPVCISLEIYLSPEAIILALLVSKLFKQTDSLKVGNTCLSSHANEITLNFKWDRHNDALSVLPTFVFQYVPLEFAITFKNFFISERLQNPSVPSFRDFKCLCFQRFAVILDSSVQRWWQFLMSKIKMTNTSLFIISYIYPITITYRIVGSSKNNSKTNSQKWAHLHSKSKWKRPNLMKGSPNFPNRFRCFRVPRSWTEYGARNSGNRNPEYQEPRKRGNYNNIMGTWDLRMWLAICSVHQSCSVVQISSLPNFCSFCLFSSSAGLFFFVFFADQSRSSPSNSSPTLLLASLIFNLSTWNFCFLKFAFILRLHDFFKLSPDRPFLSATWTFHFKPHKMDYCGHFVLDDFS